MSAETRPIAITEPEETEGPAGYWQGRKYREIIPHRNPLATASQLNAFIAERYGPDMDPYDRTVLPWLVRLAEGITKFNRHPLKQRLLPNIPASEVILDLLNEKGDLPVEEVMDLTPWMKELSSYDPQDRVVTMYTNGEYKANPDTLITNIADAIGRSALFVPDTSFNTLFHCVRDEENSKTLQKFRNVRDPRVKSSIAVLLPNRTVKIIERRSSEHQLWDDLHDQITKPDKGITCSLDYFLTSRDFDTQCVVDCCGAAKEFGIPAYCLSPFAHSGFEIDMQLGSIKGGFDHAVADGRAIQSIFMGVMSHMENNHQSGLLAGEDIRVRGQQKEEFRYLTQPHEKKQAITMIGMPDLPYVDLMMTLLQTRSSDPDDEYYSVTGTATSNYPTPFGKGVAAHKASMDNRIGIFQEQLSRHREYIEVLNQIKACLREEYESDPRSQGSWIDFAIKNYSTELLDKIPIGLLRAFSELRERSAKLTREEIALSRTDSNLSAMIINAFHGKDMSRGATRFAQKMLFGNSLQNINGTLLSNMTLDEGETRPLGSPDYSFTTITPDRNNAGLTVLMRRIITNAPFYKKFVSEAGVNIPEFDRSPLTLTRTTHTLYVEDKNPQVARSKVAILAGNLYENWILMSVLIDLTASIVDEV